MTDQPTSRDETAFSVDPATGAPSAPGSVIDRAAVAMKALDLGHVDQDGYHQLLEDDEAFTAYADSPQAAEQAPAVVEAAPDPTEHDPVTEEVEAEPEA